jgi:hypothetical protein
VTMRRIVAAFLIFALAVSGWPSVGYPQGSLEYRYGNAPTGGAAGSEQNRRLRQDLDHAFGGGSSGVIGGSIGGAIPDPEESTRRLRYEKDRAAEIEEEWNKLQKPDTVDPGEYLRAYNDKQRIDGLREYVKDKDPDHLRKWLSPDPPFRSQAASTLYDLRSSSPTDQPGKALQEAGEAAVIQADRAFSDGDVDEASLYFSIARASADLLIGLNPVTGTLQAVYEAVTGTSITGVELNDFERGLAVFSVATLGFGGEIERGINLVGKLIVGLKNTKAAENAVLFAKFIAKQFIKFRGEEKVEEAASRFIGMLVEAGSGPWQRAKDLGADYSKAVNSLQGPHPELFQLENEYVKNISLGQATRAEADAVGLAFVGENPTVTAYRQDPLVRIYYSADERYVYRSPIWKDELGRYQANLEVHAPNTRLPDGSVIVSPRKAALSNSHIDIK